MEMLERILKTLEEIRNMLQLLVNDRPTGNCAAELIRRYGWFVDKSTAAQILDVTRATVYAMLKDGRITGACDGKRVDVLSIAAYIERRAEPERAKEQ